MEQNFLHSYLRDTDCVILNGRVYNLTYGKRSCRARSFLEFRGIRFGLVAGPLIAELDRNLLVREEEKLDKIANNELESILADAKQNDVIDMTSPDYILKSFAQNVIDTYSLRDILYRRFRIRKDRRKSCEARRPSISLEQILEVKKDVLNRIRPDKLGRALGSGNMVFIGGIGYALEMSGSPLSRKDIPYVKLSNRYYVVCSQIGQLIENIIEARENMLRSSVKKIINDDARLKKLREEQEERAASDLKLLDKYYDPQRNLGFVKNSKGFFIFTKMPSYVLWEHKTDRYFSFPPAKVAVKVLLDRGKHIRISNPLIIERYRHPALDGLNLGYEHICFQFFEPATLKRASSAEKVHRLLYEGCRMMMANYCSGGKAYFNLEDDEVAEIFSGSIVPKSKVDNSKVTNRQACIAEVMRRQDARLKKAV